MTTQLTAATRLRSANSQSLVFVYPKDLNYEGYLYLVPKDSRPSGSGLGLKPVKAGVYLPRAFLKVSGINPSSEMSDRPGAFYDLKEIQVGRAVKVTPKGSASFISHTGTQVTLGKEFVEYLTHNKYLQSEADL